MDTGISLLYCQYIHAYYMLYGLTLILTNSAQTNFMMMKVGIYHTILIIYNTIYICVLALHVLLHLCLLYVIWSYIDTISSCTK